MRWLVVAVALAIVAVAGSQVVPPRSAEAADVSLLNCEFGKFQAFDVQWYIDNNTLYISSIIPPFSSYPSPHPLDIDPPDPELADTDYFKFVATDYTVPDPNPNSETAIGFNLYSSDGTLKLVMQEYGVFRAYGPGFIFYLGEGFWGTVITTGEAFEYGSSAELPVTRNSDDGAITEEEMLNYQCESEPLPPPGPVPVTVTAASTSMTAGDALPDLTPTVDPADGLAEEPVCDVYAPGDTSFTDPVDITKDSAAGDYVTHCDGASPAEDFGPITYVDGTLEVAAAPSPETTTTSTPETTTTTETPETTTTTVADRSGLPTTGQESTVPLFFIAMTLLSLGVALIMLGWNRLPALRTAHLFGRADTMPEVGPIDVFTPLATAVQSPVAPPAVEPAVSEVEDLVIEPLVVEELVVEEPAVEAELVEELVVEEPAVEAEFVEELVVEEPAVSEVEDLVIEPLVVEELVVDEPAVEAEFVEELVVEEPAVEAELVDDLEVEELVVEEAVGAEPVIDEPVIDEPIVVASSPVSAARARADRIRARTNVDLPVVTIPAPATSSPEGVAAEPSPRSSRPVTARRPQRVVPSSTDVQRASLQRRLATLDGRTDATSLAWARSIQAKLDALDD